MLLLIPLAEAQEPPAGFGTDVTVGVAAGALLGDWPDPGVHGLAGARLDVFPVSRDASGPRVGASVWGRTTVWPLPTHTDDEGSESAFGVLQYGLSAAIRHDPAAPVTGLFSFGFSRMDLTGYEGGFLAVPVFVIEAGVRQKLGPSPRFLDWTVQSGWGQARGADGGAEDWWSVSGGVAVGVHAR